MALYIGGTAVTGTQTLDATRLSGNLPAISGASLTGISGGKVVKFAGSTFTDTLSSNADTYSDWTTFKACSSFTPASSSSIIEVRFNFATGIQRCSDAGWYWRILEDASDTVMHSSQNYYYTADSSGAGNIYYGYGLSGHSFGGVYTNNATSALDFQFDFKPMQSSSPRVEGNEKIIMNAYGETASWTITEYDTS
jgi:hypothetical protein